MEKFELFCHQFQIRNSEMVRKNKIIPQLNKLVQSIDSEIKDITFVLNPPNSDHNFADFDAAAITELSSITIGTLYSLLLIKKFGAIENGR